MFRKFDKLGRLVIPKEMRKAIGLKDEDTAYIQLMNDRIIISKPQSSCIICGSSLPYITLHNKRVCKECINNLKDI